MSFMKSLENMESSLEKDLEKNEQVTPLISDNKDNKVIDFDEELEMKLSNCEAIGQLREIGEDVEETVDILLQDLKKFLINNNLSDDDLKIIINKACILIGKDNMYEIEKSR